MLNFIVSFPPYILVLRSIFIWYSRSSPGKLVFFDLLHPHPPHPQKNDSNISDISTSTQPLLKPPQKGFHAPEVLQYVSYCCLLGSSDRVEYASLISLNFFSASLSHPFLSGWYCIASFLYAFFISSFDADFSKPRTSYKFIYLYLLVLMYDSGRNFIEFILFVKIKFCL